MSYRGDILAVGDLSLPWDKLSECNILVTGATGLIGSALVEVLLSRKGHDYHVYASGRDSKRATKLFASYVELPTYHFINFDVTRPIESKVNFHYIIHCASGAAPADFSQHPVEVMKANFFGVDILLDYGRTHGMKRFLYVSSGEVYGEGDGREFSEEYSGYVDCMLPRSCYPSSKRAAETLCVSYADEFGLDVVIARPCHVFGPHFTEHDNRVYAQFIRNVLRGEDIVMKSSGEQYRSWCYVVDCVSALLHLLLLGNNGDAYNIADPSSNITIKELATLIASIGQKKVVLDIPTGSEKKGFNIVKKSCFVIEKIKGLGWYPLDTLENNLRKTINYRAILDSKMKY